MKTKILIVDFTSAKVMVLKEEDPDGFNEWEVRNRLFNEFGYNEDEISYDFGKDINITVNLKDIVSFNPPENVKEVFIYNKLTKEGMLVKAEVEKIIADDNIIWMIADKIDYYNEFD